MPLYGGGEVERGRPRLRASIHPAHEGGADDPPDQGPRLNGGGDAQPTAQHTDRGPRGRPAGQQEALGRPQAQRGHVDRLGPAGEEGRDFSLPAATAGPQRPPTRRTAGWGHWNIPHSHHAPPGLEDSLLELGHHLGPRDPCLTAGPSRSAPTCDVRPGRAQGAGGSTMEFLNTSSINASILLLPPFFFF